MKMISEMKTTSTNIDNLEAVIVYKLKTKMQMLIIQPYTYRGGGANIFHGNQNYYFSRFGSIPKQTVNSSLSVVQRGIQQPDLTLACNCRGGQSNCPVGGKCRTENVVYRATVRETVSCKAETYKGLTGREFKKRWYEHRTDINNTTKKKPTGLSTQTGLLK